MTAKQQPTLSGETDRARMTSNQHRGAEEKHSPLRSSAYQLDGDTDHTCESPPKPDAVTPIGQAENATYRMGT